MSDPVKRDAVTTALAGVLRDASGFELSELDHSATYGELGFDSLFLIQFSQRLKSSLGVKISFRQLFEELSTLGHLLDHLCETMSDVATAAPTPSDVISEAPTSVPPAALAVESSPVVAPANSAAAAALHQIAPPLASPTPPLVMPLGSPNERPASGLEGLLRQQHQLMAMQLQLLGGHPIAEPALPPVTDLENQVTATTTTNTIVPPSSTSVVADGHADGAKPTNPAQKHFERFGPYKPVRRGDGGGLTDQQRKHLEEFTARFTQRTAASRALAQKHRDHFADPRGVAGYRRIWKSMVYQIAVDRSKGSKLWDIDGNEYVDIAMGFGLNLYGQSPDFITEALHRQLDQGVELGPQSPIAGEVAKLVCEFSGQDRVTFCNTGSEAVMAAMRIARTVTGRTKCVFFNKDYHGNFDQVLLRSAGKGASAGSSPAAPGVPQFYADHTLVLDYASEASLQTIEQHADEIAAILVEPVQGADPDLQPKEYLKRLRELTERHGIVMVMDEVISGFRAAPGGAQELFGVRGDMSTYGKVLGGGLPIGALAGRADLMDALDGGTWRYEDSSGPDADMTFFAGTFVRHPLAMTAALEVLRRLKSEGPKLQRQLSEKTKVLADTLNEFFEQELIPIRIARFTSLFRFMFPPDLEYADMLCFHLLDRGIFTRGLGDKCFLSTEHSDADVRLIIEAVKSSCLELRQSGFLPSAEEETPTNSTSASVVGLVAEASKPARDKFRLSMLEEIQPLGDRPPLFVTPGADGLTLVYHELARHLGADQPMIGLNSPGVFGEPVPDTIEEMAARYVEDIIDAYPEGPYMLAGYCSGGTRAFEVAQQLIARGKTVKFLAGIETYNWYTAQSSQLNTWIRTVYTVERFYFHLRNFLLLGRHDKWSFIKSKLNAVRTRCRVWQGMLKSLLRGGRNGSKAVRQEVNYNEIWRQHDAQADRYQPLIYPGRLHLYRAKTDYRSYVAKVDLKATEDVHELRLPAYPAGLMSEPFVSQLADEMRHAMDISLQLDPSKPPDEDNTLEFTNFTREDRLEPSTP